MLDDFKYEQPIIYKTMVNAIKNNKISHAYLIECNGYNKSMELAIAFAKSIMCDKKYINSDNCLACCQCDNIDKNQFLELKIIKPDGQWIKKSQLEELQEIFSKKSIYATKKVYIIDEVERLNVSSSNSILKFLEEPEDNIIAILITGNIYQILPTIVSRCQILSLKSTNQEENLTESQKIYNYIKENKDDNIEFDYEKTIDFIKLFEEQKYKTIIYETKYFFDFYKEKKEIFSSFMVMILFYKDILNYKLGNKVQIFHAQVDIISKISSKNTINTIIKKINVIIDLQSKIKYNINNNLLLDKLIIELGRC